MILRSRIWISAVMGLGMTCPLLAQEPARFQGDRGQALASRPIPSPNQQLANTIAEQLRQSGHLRDYHIDIAYSNGTAEVTGTVCDQPQREEAIRIVQGVPGVERVRDHLTLTGAVRQIQATDPKTTEPGPLPSKSADPVPPASGSNEPFPIFQAPAPGPYDVNQPKMPPYAWPTYAPYNNYSRVAAPTEYPYSAWPYIGPNYPFPKIPLGWRKVKLEWQDGCWWYSKHSNSHDWWRLRYW